MYMLSLKYAVVWIGLLLLVIPFMHSGLGCCYGFGLLLWVTPSIIVCAGLLLWVIHPL